MQMIGKWYFPDRERQQREEVEKTGSWQIDRLLAALDHVDDFSVAYDIGAHVGLWTYELAKKFGRVVAFEPVPEHLACLNKNVGVLQNVVRFGCGLSDYDGTAEAVVDDRLGEQNTGGSFLQVATAGDVEVCKLDTLWTQGKVPPPSFMKIDVEGWEVHVLEGASSLIHECYPIILVEDKPKFRNRANFHYGPGDWLAAVGYEQIANYGADKLYRKDHG